MNKQVKFLFLLLVVAQSFHSIEEYIGRLWENFPPATWLCGIVSNDLRTGFLFINIGLFLFGIWAWRFPVQKNHVIAPFIIGFWILIELMNGIGHPIWSIVQKSYTPGVITAPILFVLAIQLLRKYSSLPKE